MHSTPITKRSRRRTRLMLAAGLTAALAACALPAAASAATVGIVDDTLSYQGGSERNSLSLREVAGTLIVSDTSGVSNIFIPATDPRPRCAVIDSKTLRCPLVDRVVARMGGGGDTAGPINTRLPVEIRGDSGNDTYNAGSPSFLTQVEFRGGFDTDTASYAGSGGSAVGGVRISNDGVANDGRIGLDTDNIGTDVSRLIGSARPDEITANGPLILADCCTTVVTGGQGDDVLRAGSSGQHVTFAMGPAADGADKIIGGRVPSKVDYEERTRPVTATLNFGGADDGDTGERDEILGGHEQLLGGQAGDTLQAPFGSRAAHDIRGNGGGDTIDGADGADTLIGGPGGDSIRAFGGSDQLFLRDGETDTVSCGLEIDTVELDSVDNLGNDCENRTVGVLRLTPKALRARAGEIATAKLSWRHPRSWRRLRRIELRVVDGDVAVGVVTISPRTRRIADRGAVIVLRRSRLVRRGKTVSARLALRLGRSLAGRRLRVEVAAVDVRGARQLEPRVGSIRVSR